MASGFLFQYHVSLIYSYCVLLWLVSLHCYIISYFMKVSQFLWSSYNFWSQSLIEMGLAFAWGCWWPVLHLTVALAIQVKINRLSNVLLGHRYIGHDRQLKCFPEYYTILCSLHWDKEFPLSTLFSPICFRQLMFDIPVDVYAGFSYWRFTFHFLVLGCWSLANLESSWIWACTYILKLGSPYLSNPNRWLGSKLSQLSISLLFSLNNPVIVLWSPSRDILWGKWERDCISWCTQGKCSPKALPWNPFLSGLLTSLKFCLL